ncbi:MAG: hypothetical protein IT324_03020 [Anaerolineae bacterium]|nr:hypothetical protein [Anaerolineae bacterium]
MMRRFKLLLAGLIAVGLLSVCNMLSELFTPFTTQVDQGIEPTLTALYGNEVKSIIEQHHLKYGSLPVQQNPNRLSEVTTGPLFDQLIATYTGKPPYLITKGIKIVEVRVLEYTPAQSKAIACGTWTINWLEPNREIGQSDYDRSFRLIYVFVREILVWKLAAVWDFTDYSTLYRDWEYATQQQKDYIGDLLSYARQYFICPRGTRE